MKRSSKTLPETHTHTPDTPFPQPKVTIIVKVFQEDAVGSERFQQCISDGSKILIQHNRLIENITILCVIVTYKRRDPLTSSIKVI